MYCDPAKLTIVLNRGDSDPNFVRKPYKSLYADLTITTPVLQSQQESLYFCIIKTNNVLTWIETVIQGGYTDLHTDSLHVVWRYTRVSSCEIYYNCPRK